VAGARRDRLGRISFSGEQFFLALFAAFCSDARQIRNQEEMFMYKILISLAMTVLMTATLAASEKDDVMAAVNNFVTAFNKSDSKAAIAACADDMAIIDEFPPYEWHGAGTCSKWLADYDADTKKNGMTEGVVTIGKPRHLDVAGDRAYVVVPAIFSFKEHGKPVKEKNATWTLTLQKTDGGWKFTGWAWGKP
jgi:ketosteroid isomerase-like protein